MHHHGAGLRQILAAEGMAVEECDAIVAGLKGDLHETKGLTQREQALLLYADKLTLTPGALGLEDVERLRRVGLDDLAIHDTCAIIAYFAFVNRIADGLGVELEGAGPEA
jgi:uncharacterized peroxidase-related enzyme